MRLPTIFHLIVRQNRSLPKLEEPKLAWRTERKLFLQNLATDGVITMRLEPTTMCPVTRLESFPVPSARHHVNTSIDEICNDNRDLRPDPQ